MPIFSHYDSKKCKASLRGLEEALLKMTKKLRHAQVQLELQIRDLLPEREGAAQTLGGRCCQIPRQMKAYDLLAMQCRLLYDRLSDIEDVKACPTDLVGVVGTLIYASEAVDMPEPVHLAELRRQLGLKFGEKFCRPFHDSWTRGIDQSFVGLIAVYAPRRHEIFDVLEKVAVKHRIHWSRPIDSRAPADLSARIRSSVCGLSPRSPVSSLPFQADKTGLVYSGAATSRSSIRSVKQEPECDDGDQTPPTSRFAPPLPPHLRKRVSNSNSSLFTSTPRRSTTSSSATPSTCESGLADSLYPSGYDVPVTKEDEEFEKLRLRLERIRRSV
ncbi:Vacuolar protein sorting-associated protein ist1 [Perkinsus chesapeaki]|uniref:Vacuolar protein sorting-associated protein ist1 n=1 Tax=Perkinsus chesapeaki TaxID=330153 RepID=A0A7J6LP71_PERCH|nr:Vacuolar protein sorting-associated protein ist1 [Perkinsus chesapeaki]